MFHWVQNEKRRKEIEDGIRICLQTQNKGTATILGDPICVIKHEDSKVGIYFEIQNINMTEK